MTGDRHEVKVGRIIPVAEAKWYGKNVMHDYAIRTNATATQNLKLFENEIRLREEILDLWDAGAFILIPKTFDGGKTYQLVSHVLDLKLKSMFERYHNVEMRFLEHAPIEYLFARFAMMIIERAPLFLRSVGASGVIMPSKLDQWEA